MWNMELEHDLTFWESKRAGRLATVDILQWSILLFFRRRGEDAAGGVKLLVVSECRCAAGVYCT